MFYLIKSISLAIYGLSGDDLCPSGLSKELLLTTMHADNFDIKLSSFIIPV